MKFTTLCQCVVTCGLIFYGMVGYADCRSGYDLCVKSCNRYHNRCIEHGSRTKPPEHCGGQYEQCMQGCSAAESNCPLPEAKK